MAATGLINRFLAQAERRHWSNLALEYFGMAASAGAAGLILLLLLGTQIFNWYWPLILFTAALLAGFWLARRRLLSTYKLAQVVDVRLGLHDRLATVVYFHDHECRSESCLEAVTRQAAERIECEDVRQAMPIAMPKYGYYSLALIAAAGGLVGVRYGVLHTLELEQPLARIDFGLFSQPSNVQAASKKSVIQERLEQQLRELGLNVEDNTAPDEDALKPIEAQVPAQAEGGQQMQDPTGKKQGQQMPPGVQEVESPSEEGEKSNGEGSESGDGAASDQNGQQSKQQNPPKEPKQGESGGRDGLMNKMKDALANLLNKMKMGSQSEQQQTASLNQQQGANARQQSNEQGMQSRSKSDGQGQPSPDQEGEEGQGEKMPGDQSKAGERAGDKPGDQNSKTGMGRQDGDKDIKDAEQLAAMGKISEIFGKRAQQLTGEMTVEVSSKKQTLKTAYSSQRATHADTGAEVNRDEIPLAYQSYVQRYFEEVRKTTKKN